MSDAASSPRKKQKLSASELISLNTSKNVHESLNWPISQAIRELLLNACDADPENCSAFCEGDSFKIQNQTKGLNKSSLVYKSNKDKIENTEVGGKFGYGLKDAIVILFAHNIKWSATSNFGTFEVDIATSKDIVYVKYSDAPYHPDEGTVQQLTPLKSDVSLVDHVQKAKDQCLLFNERLQNYIKEPIREKGEKQGTIFFRPDISEYSLSSTQLNSTLFVHNCGYNLIDHSSINKRKFLFDYNLNLSKDNLKSRDRDTLPVGWSQRIGLLVRNSKRALNLLILAQSREDAGEIYELNDELILKNVRVLEEENEKERKRETIRNKEKETDMENAIERLIQEEKIVAKDLAAKENEFQQLDEEEIGTVVISAKADSITNEKATLSEIQEKLSNLRQQYDKLKSSESPSSKIPVYVHPKDLKGFNLNREIYEPKIVKNVTDKAFLNVPSSHEAVEMAKINLGKEFLSHFKQLSKFLRLLGLEKCISVDSFTDSSGPSIRLTPIDNKTYKIYIYFPAFNSSDELIRALSKEFSRLPFVSLPNSNEFERLGGLVCTIFKNVPDNFEYKPVAPLTLKKRSFCPLFVATEWGTSKGGISSFNMQLALGLSKICDKVFVLLIDETPSAPQIEFNIYLVDGYIYRNQFHPVLNTPEFEITHIIGHAHITGKIAQQISQLERFQHTKLWLFNHVTPDIVDLHKNKKEQNSISMEETLEHQINTATIKTQDINQLNMLADYVWSVGPLLYNHWNSDIESKHSEIVLPLNPDFLSIERKERKRKSANDLRILFVGRIDEVLYVKGLDIALKSFQKLKEEPHFNDLKLRIRGISVKEIPQALEIQYNHDEIVSLSQIKGVEYKPFDKVDGVLEDLKISDLFIMPSRCEPFGLVATEAIAAGVPVLVSSNSGIAELLTISNCPDKEDMKVETTIVPKLFNESSAQTSMTVDAWVKKIKKVLNDEHRIENANKVKAHFVQYFEESNPYQKMIQQGERELEM